MLPGRLTAYLQRRQTLEVAKGHLMYLSARTAASVRMTDLPVEGGVSGVGFEKAGSFDNVKCEPGHLFFNEERSVAQPSKQILIKMKYAPINPSDLNQIQGRYPIPKSSHFHVCGNEGVGVVAAVGAEVSSLKPGDVVIPRKNNFGTWREQVICLEDDVFPLPSSFTSTSSDHLITAATLKVNPPTAYRLLKDYLPSNNSSLVIVQNGANSAVGRYIIQLARLWNIKTVNIVRDRPGFEKLEKELLDLGADHVVKAERFALSDTQNYLLSLLNGNRPSVGFNCVGGLALSDMSRFVSEGASIITYGGMSGKNPVISAGNLIFKNLKFEGFWMSRWYENASPEEYNNMMNELINLFSNGSLIRPQYKVIDFHTHWWKSLPNTESEGKGKEKIILKF